MDGPSSTIYIPQTTNHYSQLGLPAPNFGFFGGQLGTVIGSEFLSPNGTTTQDNAVTNWTTLFAGTTQNTASGWRNTNNTLLPGAGVSYAALLYISILTVGANARRVFTAASTGYQTRVNTTGAMVSLGTASATGSANHIGTMVRPHLYYRNASNTTGGLMTDLEHIQHTYSSAAFTTLSTHAFGAENAGIAAEMRCCLWHIWIGNDAATIANKTTLQTLGWTIPW